jgi:hypothetical protein
MREFSPGCVAVQEIKWESVSGVAACFSAMTNCMARHALHNLPRLRSVAGQRTEKREAWQASGLEERRQDDLRALCLYHPSAPSFALVTHHLLQVLPATEGRFSFVSDKKWLALADQRVKPTVVAPALHTNPAAKWSD